MSSYAGLDEIGLTKLLDTSSDITERRKIRAALREVRTNNNNSVVHPHLRTPISPAKLSHHQSFRAERRRRPDVDDLTKTRSQDDDILYRSRRRREMDAGRGRGGGEDGDDENEVVVDIEVKIKEIGNDEQKLTKLLSETRDFNDRRKVRSAIREVKRKTRQQDGSDTPTKPTNQSDDGPPAEPAVSVLQENQTNLALSRSTEGQRSSAEGQDFTQTTIGRGVEQEIVALQKQLESAETYEERRKLRTEIRELRQKKTGFDEDVPQSQMLQEQQPLNQENGMGCHIGSKVNRMSDQEEGKENRGDVFLNQVPPPPMVGDEEEDDEENPYAIVNGYANDEGNDTRTDDIQDREYAEPSFTEGPDHGYAESQTHDYVDKEEEFNSSVTDTEVDLPGMITNGEDTMPVKSVDTMANKNPVVNKPGCGDTGSSNSIQESRDNDYEIITPRPIQPNYAQIHKEVPLIDVCENETNISKSPTREIPLDSPDLIKTLPSVPLKTKVFQKTEEKMEWKKEVVEEKDKVQVVRNLLPSEIKKKQVGPTGIKVNKTNVTKPNTYNPPKPSQNTNQNSVNSPNVEVVHRPPGSRRARIIRSYLELERIKREGVNRADGKPIQINAPNLMAMGSGMKSGRGVRGSDQMLEDMLNLQLMQAMGMNPHTIATPNVDTGTKSTPPVRPSHLDIPSPIKTTKPVPKQTPKQTPKQSPKLPSSRLQPSGPSHGIAKMLNRFGENTTTTPKPASQSYLGSGKGLKKTPARNAFNIDVKNGEVDINISEDNRQFLMNKLAPHTRGKGKLP